MSANYIRYIPECVDEEIAKQNLSKIGKLTLGGVTPNIIINEKVAFADAGENFASVVCPFCNTGVMGWWGGAMSAAFFGENGFGNLNVITPCCEKPTSLHYLLYNYPQGFYRIMVEFEPISADEQSVGNILAQLERITDSAWRTINSRY